MHNEPTTRNPYCTCCDNDHERGGYNLANLAEARIQSAYNDARQFEEDDVCIKHPSQHEHYYTFEQVRPYLTRR